MGKTINELRREGLMPGRLYNVIHRNLSDILGFDRYREWRDGIDNELTVRDIFDLFYKREDKYNLRNWKGLGVKSFEELKSLI